MPRSDPPSAVAGAQRPLVAWIFNHYAAEPGHPAGTRHHDLAVRMRRAGIEITIYASGFSHFSRREEKVRGLSLWRNESIDGVRFVWVRTPAYAGNGLRRALSMAAYAVVAAMAQVGKASPDVIVGSTVHPLAALAASLVARARRRPFIFEIRDLWPETLIEMGAIRRSGLPAQLLYGIEARLVRDAKTVVSVLPGIADYFETRSLKPRQLAYVPNGHRLTAEADLPPADLVGLVDAWRTRDRVVFGYVGAHGNANGLDTLLDAMHLIRGADAPAIGLLFVGDGPEKARLRARAAAEGLEDVAFADPIPKRSVQAVHGLLDSGIFHLAPNAVFRFGISSNKLFDYMGNGLPVIFACTSTYDPVERSGGGISVAPNDPEALARAMIDLAGRSADERRRMGDRARTYVRREHDLDALADRFGTVLREAAGRSVV